MIIVYTVDVDMRVGLCVWFGERVLRDRVFEEELNWRDCYFV
jgi:hypothetical protein